MFLIILNKIKLFKNYQRVVIFNFVIIVLKKNISFIVFKYPIKPNTQVFDNIEDRSGISKVTKITVMIVDLNF